MGAQTRKHLGNAEEALTLNVSRLFPRLHAKATYFEDVELCLGNRNVLLLSRLLTPATL